MRLRPLGHDRRRKNEQRNERRCTHRRNSSMENPEGKSTLRSIENRARNVGIENRPTHFVKRNFEDRQTSFVVQVLCRRLENSFRSGLFSANSYATLFSPTIFSIDTQTRSKRGRNREYRTANTLSTELDQKWRLRTQRPRRC